MGRMKMSFVLLLCFVGALILQITNESQLLPLLGDPPSERSDTVSNTSTANSSGQYHCMPFGYDHLLKNGTTQVFLLMAAKAGGSSLHSFANKCSGNPPDNWLNQDARLKPFLLSSLHLPKIIAAHLYVGDRPMIDVIRHASRDSLIIYVYRDETDRLMSAIKFVVKERLCVKGFQFKKAFGSTLPKVFGLNNTEKQCSFDEKPFVEELIEKRVAEVGYSIPMQLTCDLWNEVEETGPTLLFLHYSQLDALQAKLAAHYCPDVQPQRKNVDALKSSKKYTIRLQKGGEVSLDDWIAAKRSTIEFALKLPGGSCKRKTRMMEDALLSSPNKMVQMVSSHQENN